MAISEENLKLENDTLNLKKEYKHALENLTRVKSDTNDILAIRDKATKDLKERNEEKLRIENEIASSKIAWIQQQSRDMDDLKDKQSEAQNVINRKAELNRQEEEIRKIEARDIEIRNEARQLEFKNIQENTALDVREREIKEEWIKIEKREKDMAKSMAIFKGKASEILKGLELL